MVVVFFWYWPFHNEYVCVVRYAYIRFCSATSCKINIILFPCFVRRMIKTLLTTILVSLLINYNSSFHLNNRNSNLFQSASAALFYDYLKKGPEKVLCVCYKLYVQINSILAMKIDSMFCRKILIDCGRTLSSLVFSSNMRIRKNRWKPWKWRQRQKGLHE